MIKICVVKSEAELVVLRSILESEGIDFFVKNDNFGTTVMGPRIDNYNAKTVWVAEPFESRARAIVEDLRRETQDSGRAPGVLDRFRMVVEAVFLGWFVPGRRRRQKDGSKPADE